jgi:hypothetical protein
LSERDFVGDKTDKNSLLETLRRVGNHAMICRSLKMRSNADSSGNGYIYEKGDLIETESISEAEKEEFSVLTEFVKSKLNNANA